MMLSTTTLQNQSDQSDQIGLLEHVCVATASTLVVRARKVVHCGLHTKTAIAIDGHAEISQSSAARITASLKHKRQTMKRLCLYHCSPRPPQLKAIRPPEQDKGYNLPKVNKI